MGELADAVGEGGGAPGEGGHEFVVGVCEAGGVVDPGAVEASAVGFSIPHPPIDGGGSRGNIRSVGMTPSKIMCT